MRKGRIAMLAFGALVSLSSCYAGTASPYSDGAAGAPASSTGTGSTLTVEGTPCAVSDMLSQYCIRCHNEGALSASDVPLTSYTALTAPISGGGTVAERALAKMNDSNKPMPPRGEPAPSAAAVQAFSDWVAAGMTPGQCASSGVDGGSASQVPSPYDTPSMCSSGTHWTSGNRESPNMHPGRACIACHASGEGPRFQFAGTLFASAHEPDDCNGAALDTRIIITDANGTELVLTPNSVGNFGARRTSLVMPYTARLERGDQVREMVTEQQDGDCNGCHTESGKNKAPGRIMAP